MNTQLSPTASFYSALQNAFDHFNAELFEGKEYGWLICRSDKRLDGEAIVRLTLRQPHSPLIARFQSAQKSPRHRRPQCPSIEPCFQDHYVRAAVERRVDSLCDDISA